jgi:hypothetical protein
MLNFNTGKNDLSNELKRAQDLQTQKSALEVDSTEWDAFVDFDSPESQLIRSLNEALEAFEHEQIYQNGLGVIKDTTYQALRKILKTL